MLGTIRGTCLALAGIGALAAFVLRHSTPAEAQPPGPTKSLVLQAPPPLPDVPGPPRRLTIPPRWDLVSPSRTIALPTDPSLKTKFDALPDYVKEALWPEAVRTLQALLDTREDVFVPLIQQAPDGTESIQWRSVRAEANRMLGTLPRAALEFYEVSFGPKARALLADARARSDARLLAQVAQRYLYTRAGAEATAHLATYHLDRGRYLMAALCFDRLIERVGLDQLPALDLYRATLAFHRAGDPANAERTWKRLAEKARGGLRLGERQVELADLEKALGKPGELALGTGPAREWAMFRGGPSRSASVAGNGPAPLARWDRPLVQDFTVESWLEDAVRQQQTRSQPVLPASVPVAAAGRLVYRSFRGVHAVDARTGELLWESTSDGSLEQMAQDPRHQTYVGQWVAAHVQYSPNALWENGVLGTLSSNGSLVFAVEDLAVPPLPGNYAGFAGQRGQGLRLAFAPELTDAVYHSRLRALDLDTGKLVWEAGGRGEGPGSPLLGCHFLGPPLPLAGKLYVLTEKEQELRLLCLDAARGELAWTQRLATVANRIVLDGARRVQAAHPACGEGILVCPTNAGALIGVDLLTGSLVWAHIYREDPKPPEPPPGLGRGRRPREDRNPPKPSSLEPEWRAAAPLIHSGKVISAAPDAPQVHCLSLRDGTLHWKAARNPGDLYLGGISGGNVLVVGKDGVRALDLANGKVLWKVETGPVSGQGVVGEGVYYVPVRSAGGKEHAVCAVDTERGVVRGRTPVSGPAAPGNLVFHEGVVFSQTVTAVTAYPQIR